MSRCWLMFYLLTTRIPSSFSSELLSSWVAPSLSWCLGLLLSWCRTLHFHLWNIMRFLSAHFSSLSLSLWMAGQLTCTSASPHHFGIISKLAANIFLIIHITNEDVCSIYLSYDPWGMLLMTGINDPFGKTKQNNQPNKQKT